MIIRKKKQKKQVYFGVVTIKSTINNTILTLCDILGNTLAWSSSGCCGFTGTRKGTPFAAQLSAKKLLAKATEMDIQKLGIIIKGKGIGREIAARTLMSTGLEITSIEYKMLEPHNGCRLPNKRKL